MAFDFSSFRRLLFQNALEDAIHMLEKNAPDNYKEAIEKIASQLSALQKSQSWKILKHTKKNKDHANIVRNLYQNGLSIYKNEPPPELISVNPWRKLIVLYSGILFFMALGLFLITYQAPCPDFEDNKEISILIDRFSTLNQPLLQKIGLNKETLEKQISEQLSRDNISTAVHRVNIANRDHARARCEECGARMVIWGDVEYGDSIRAYLYHYLDHESYDSYIMKHNIPGVEEHYKNVFKLQTSQWIGDIQCLIKLFQGLMAKEKFQQSKDEEKAKAIAEAENLFNELSLCASDMALKIFALQCLGWAEVKRNKDQEALETYNEILSLDSNNTLALNNSALLYEKQNNHLYAHTRYERILHENDIPYIRLANAEALTKLDRKEEAQKEIKTVRNSDDYKIKKDIYETKIKTIPTNAVTPGSNVSALSPSLSLNTIATQINLGQNTKALNNLDLLSSGIDTATYTREDILIISELYKKAGAPSKANRFSEKAAVMGVPISVPTTTLSKAVRRTQ